MPTLDRKLIGRGKKTRDKGGPMNNQRKIQILILAFGLLTFTSASADEVRMKNGDRITGKIVMMEKEKLVLDTEYAGEITLAWPQVASVSAEEPIRILLKDGTSFEGRTTVNEEGKIILKTAQREEPLVFGLADIKTLNPKSRSPVKITVRADLGLVSQKGNTNTDSAHVDASLLARTQKSRFAVAGELNRENADGQETVNNWSVYGNYDYFVRPKWFWYARTQFEHDELADLELRTTLGTGLGYQIFEGETLNLSFAAGPSYVNENFIMAEDESFSATQWIVNYDQYLFDKFLQIFHTDAGYMSFINPNRWMIKTRQGLRFPLKKGLSLTIQYNYDYNNQPAPGAEEKYDSKFMVLVGYKFES
jgi:putative salt-induced outer membrane protein YdiY